MNGFYLMPGKPCWRKGLIEGNSNCVGKIQRAVSPQSWGSLHNCRPISPVILQESCRFLAENQEIIGQVAYFCISFLPLVVKIIVTALLKLKIVKTLVVE